MTLTDRARVDLVLDHLAAVRDDFAQACEALWAVVQAESPCELEHALHRARAYLLVSE